MGTENKALAVVCNVESLNEDDVKESIDGNLEIISILVVGKENNKDKSKALFKCDNIIFAEHDVYLFINGIYKAKRAMDQHRIKKCFIFAPKQLTVDLSSICKLIMPSYDYNIIPTPHIDIKMEDLTESDVEKYLKSLSSCDELKIYKSTLIPDSFSHGYTSRQGGISTHPDQASLNLCYSSKKADSLSTVMENRRRVSNAGGFDHENFFVASCVHGREVWVHGETPPASYDAIICNQPGVTIAAPGADCNMVIFCDPVTKSCAAAHAGWKGILAGIIENTVEKMTENYRSKPEELIVAVGPSLCVCCCEFGSEGAKPFSKIDEKCVVWKAGFEKPFLDLRLAVQILLERKGVRDSNIDAGVRRPSSLRICTKCDPSHRFFSFRRVGSQFGNQVGFIGVAK